MAQQAYNKYNIDYNLALKYITEKRMTKKELATKLGVGVGPFTSWLYFLPKELKLPLQNRFTCFKALAAYKKWNYESILNDVKTNKLILVELNAQLKSNLTSISKWMKEELTETQRNELTQELKKNKSIVKRPHKKNKSVPLNKTSIQTQEIVLPYKREEI